MKVGTLIGQSLPVTASLVAGGMVLMLLLALPLGCIAALRPRAPVDRGLLAVSVIGLAVHPFVLGITIRDFFVQQLHVYSFNYCPLTGSHATVTPFGVASPACGGPVDWARHMAVPWFVFALFFLPIYMRMIRVRLLETFSEPWISTARAKGASERRVVVGHALRNAIGPVLPMLAIDAGTAITAAIYVETVFGLGGLGSLAVQAFSGQAGGYDLPLTAGIVTVVGAFVVLLNVGADVAGAWLDPRIRARSASGLIPLPQAVASRPNVRRGLNVAVGLIVVALVALAVTHKEKSPSAFDLGTPVKVVRVNWDDIDRVEAQVETPTGLEFQHGYLETHVSAVEFGRYGWRVFASIANKSPLTIQLSRANESPGSSIAYPNQPMSLLVQVDEGSGTRYLKPLPAQAFAPAMPAVLKPHTTWAGTFAGSDPVDRGQLFYVGFGQFLVASPIVGGRPLSTSTAKSARAP
jgi:peptide/nickel transport system permease protein